MTIVNDLVPSVSIDAILMRRTLLREALEATTKAYEKAIEARYALFGDVVDEYGCRDHERHDGSRSMSSELRMEYHAQRYGKHYRPGYELNDPRGLEYAYQAIDAECWSHLLAKSGLMQLMDAATRNQWREQLDSLAMPEFNEGNIAATFGDLYTRRGDLFEEGVVAVFQKLSWDYKTNSPVKFGKRMVQRYACERFTYRDKKTGKLMTDLHGPSHGFADKLDDLVRAFCVLEGKPEPDHAHGAYATMTTWMKGNEGEALKRDVELHGYLKFRGFKNGNAHVTFLRLDLVDKLNKIIAKRFPNALPASRETE